MMFKVNFYKSRFFGVRFFANIAAALSGILNKHISFQNISGTSRSYNEDSLTAFQLQGATSNNYNEAMIQWLQSRTGSNEPNINNLKVIFAKQQGFSTWDNMNRFN